jgi:membrane protein implicated in regulation of membrane protease activity
MVRPRPAQRSCGPQTSPGACEGAATPSVIALLLANVMILVALLTDVSMLVAIGLFAGVSILVLEGVPWSRRRAKTASLEASTASVRHERAIG